MYSFINSKKNLITELKIKSNLFQVRYIKLFVSYPLKVITYFFIEQMIFNNFFFVIYRHFSFLYLSLLYIFISLLCLHLDLNFYEILLSTKKSICLQYNKVFISSLFIVQTSLSSNERTILNSNKTKNSIKNK